MKNVFYTFISANILALQYFNHCRKTSKKAQKYLKSRLSQETVYRYRIGYAPPIGLAKWLHSKGVSPFVAQQLGLIRINQNGTLSSTFKNRIMLPIMHAGYVVGFGARALDDDQPKYINSKTSKIYKKKEILFNLHFARQHIDRLGYVLLVEGYFDVLGLVDAGIRNVVATCGTAFSFEQALLLKRYTDRVYTFFDGDDAGFQAAERAKPVLQKLGLYKGKILLPKGYDPDTFVQKRGKKALKDLRVII
jgi:DNA primase